MFNSTAINRISVWYFLVVLTVISFTWSERLSSIGVTLLTLHWLFDKRLFDKISSIHTQLKPYHIRLISTLLFSFFFLHVIGLTWSQHLLEGWQSIEVKLTFLVLPLLFSTENYLDTKKKALLFFIFSVSCCLSFLYAFSYSYHHHQLHTWIEITNRMNISEGIMHPGYYSNYFAYALVWSVVDGKNNATLSYKQKQVILFLFIPFLSTALLLLISKTAILYISCFIFYLVWHETAGIKQWLKRYVVFTFCIGFIGIIATQIPSIRNRILETFHDTDILNKEVPLANSTGSRIAAWQSEWTLIKEKWLVGYGTGSANIKLKKRLADEGYIRLSEENMHTHNQVFHTWIDIGIVGVLLLFSFLWFCAVHFRKNKNKIALWLIPLIFLNILTDDMFEVQAGVVFFIFFLTLFIYQKEDNENKISYS